MQLHCRENNKHNCKICEHSQEAQPAMDKQGKNLHLWLDDQALMGCDMYHKGVNDMTSMWKSSVQYMAYA
jgi:hypothetical protein